MRDPAMEKVLLQNNGQLPSSSGSAQAATSGTAAKAGWTRASSRSNASGKLRAVFVPVTTGITGATDIEVLTGLKQGDEIVTGRYQVLRALKSGRRQTRQHPCNRGHIVDLVLIVLS